MLTAHRLRQCLRYEAATGKFFRLRQQGRGRRTGLIDVKPNSEGYLLICIDSKKYRASRLAWLYVYGKWPLGDLDHKDGNKTNERIENLRLATRSQNTTNGIRRRTNTSGFKGVSQCVSRGVKYERWFARITKNSHVHHLGCFGTPKEAHAAYVKAAKKLFGEFARAE